MLVVAVHDIGEHGRGSKRHGEGLDPEEGDGDVDCCACCNRVPESDICDRGKRGGDGHEDEAEFGLVDAVVAFRHELSNEIGAVA